MLKKNLASAFCGGARFFSGNKEKSVAISCWVLPPAVVWQNQARQSACQREGLQTGMAVPVETGSQ